MPWAAGARLINVIQIVRNQQVTCQPIVRLGIVSSQSYPVIRIPNDIDQIIVIESSLGGIRPI